MDLVGLIVQLIAGAVGGAGAGKAVKSIDLGNVGNIIAGLIGGAGLPALAGMIPCLEMLSSFGGGAAAAGGSLDIGSLLGQGVGGAVGGGALTAIVGAIKNATAKG